MKATILGCGTSGGVPLVTGNWGACDPSNPKNRRRRVSLLVEADAATVLIDTSPDLREQMLSVGHRRIDAVLFTHHHADHCHGVDDLRFLIYSQGREPIDAFMDPVTHRVLTRRFPYIFASSRDPESPYRPLLTDHVVSGPFSVGGLPILPFEQIHGFGEITLGYRIGGLAYSTDVVDLDDVAFAALAGLDVWIVDCLRYQPHRTHAHFDLTLSWIERAKPKRAILTHMTHDLDYEELRARCPAGVEPAFDGMVIELAG